MSNHEFLTNNYPIDRLTAVLDNSQVCASPVDGGYLGVISIPDEILEKQDKDILSEFMRADNFPDKNALQIVMRGSDRNPIVFESEKDAKLTAQGQVRNLGKQLLFSIFRKTGIKFSIGVQSFNF